MRIGNGLALPRRVLPLPGWLWGLPLLCQSPLRDSISHEGIRLALKSNALLAPGASLLLALVVPTSWRCTRRRWLPRQSLSATSALAAQCLADFPETDLKTSQHPPGGNSDDLRASADSEQAAPRPIVC